MTLVACAGAADEVAFGSRKSKLAGCARQKKAWDSNCSIMADILTSIRPPLPEEIRKRGEFGRATHLQREAAASRSMFQPSSDSVAARMMFRKATMG